MKIYLDKPEAYWDELFTKRILVYIDINDDRNKSYKGITQIFNGQGTQPFHFNINAKTIEEAFELYDQSCEDEFKAVQAEAEAAQLEAQREEASKIIIPHAPLPKLNIRK